ncbi:hypothetical protein CEP53_000101 [Fusarium sp. AF-6]|nr:hypothetical protein CEP53_000101 [Fusarium sp. AF-6]
MPFTYVSPQTTPQKFCFTLSKDDMKPSLACWENDGGQDDNNEARRVLHRPARASSSFSKEDLVLVRIRSVADPEYLRQSRSYQVSDCETMMTEVRKAFGARKISPLLDQFEKPLHIIDQFVKGMTVLVQALDPIAQIIWGGFLIVFKNVVRFVDLISTISACFDTLSNTLARFQIYSKMYSTERVTTSLGGLCACCVEFCAAASKLFHRRSTFSFLRLIWDPLDHKFEQLRRNIEVAEKDFVQEVGLQHAKETHELAQAIKPKGPKIPCHIMSPAKNRLFFPRLDIMEKVETVFFPNEDKSRLGHRSFLLHGLGGVGKTQLAAHFAYTHWDDYDIIIWAVADTEQSLDDHFLQAAAALGLPHAGDASAIVTNVMNWLTDCNHNWLIIFDNVDNESLLLRFWPKSAKGSILLTSRQRLLGTTMVDGACEVSSLEKEDGASMIQLLLENEVSDAQDRHLVEEMAKALGGLPLALAQMAGYLRTNHVTVKEFLGNHNNSEYARRLFGRPASLDHEQHQQTLETVWRLSLEKLSADAKTLLWIIVFLHPDEMPCSIFQIREVSPGMSLLPALQVLDTSHNTLQ